MILRRRLVLPLSLLVGIIIIILAYSGIKSSQSNMLKLITQQGESTMQALITSAGNNLAASAIMEEASADRLVELGSLLGRLIDRDARLVDSLDVWERRYGLTRLDLVDAGGRIVSSSWDDFIGRSVEGDSDRVVVYDSVIVQGLPIASNIPLPSALPQEDLAYIAVATNRGVLILEASSTKLSDYQESLGIGYVIRQMGGQEAIDYVVLQTDSSIVLASRSISPMVALGEDAFLTAALGHEQTASRLYEFEGREVLEVVRSFKSDVMPSGLFRIGMSLEVYHQLYSDSLKQLGVLSIVLFALGIVGAWAATFIRRLEKTEGSLEQLRSMTDEIVQSLEAAVVATDRGGKITLFNPEAERLFGKSARAVQGIDYSSIFPRDELALDRIRTNPAQVYRSEVMYPRESGEKMALLVSSAPLYDRSGAFNGSVSLAYDLTEIKRLEENARASERLSELGTLAAGVAHEIRNPLNAIAIATQRLQIEFTPNENGDEYRAFLKTIASEIDRLNAIIKDFLALARGNKLDKVLVELSLYVDEIISLAKLEIEDRGIAFTKEIAPGLTAEIDRNEMKKVFLNLIRNAMQAIDGPGSIIIRAVKGAGDRVQIDIENSGAPISESDRAKIFLPYFTTRPDGTGLGLAICRRIVINHGGTLELLEGEPTTFRIVV